MVQASQFGLFDEPIVFWICKPAELALEPGAKLRWSI